MNNLKQYEWVYEWDEFKVTVYKNRGEGLIDFSEWRPSTDSWRKRKQVITDGIDGNSFKEGSAGNVLDQDGLWP